MTGKERDHVARELARAVCDVEIRGTSVELVKEDVRAIREQFAYAIVEKLGETLKIDLERFGTLVDVAAMTVR